MNLDGADDKVAFESDPVDDQCQHRIVANRVEHGGINRMSTLAPTKNQQMRQFLWERRRVIQDKVLAYRSSNGLHFG